jgi:beta-phosphoglucomutase-like phosphatase (HAD superfamily)
MKQKYTFDEIYNHSQPDFGKQMMLKKLKKMGIKIACCSNSIRKSIEMMLNKALILDYFDLIISNQDIKKAKPDPEMYLKAMDTF